MDHFTVMLMFVLVVLILALPPSERTASPACGDGPSIGRIVDITRVDHQPVQIRRVDESAWAVVSEGAVLCTGDQIRTRFQSRARIRYESPGSGGRIDVTAGVNTRLRTVGAWNAVPTVGRAEAALDIVHGVVKLDGENDQPHVVSTGPSLCVFAGDRIFANWDPFKREANYLVERGRVSCVFGDSTVVVNSGESLEIIGGRPEPVRQTVPLILSSFQNATR